MKIPKNLISCPVCKTRNEYEAFKNKKAHEKGWKNKFDCPACHAPLKQQWSGIIFSLTALGFIGYLTFFTDFDYTFLILFLVLSSMFLLLYSGLIFKVADNA